MKNKNKKFYTIEKGFDDILLLEFKSLIRLYNSRKENDKKIFMQFASLGIDCKIIIWVIFIINN
jgi:hypothetical protein